MQFDATLNLPTLVTLGLAIIGVVIWLVRLEGRVNGHDTLGKRVEAMAALDTLHSAQLAEYKTHVAETYVTKQGMNDQTKQILDAITGVASRVDGLGTRLDGIVDRQER